MSQHTVYLDWPPNNLSPNARHHWAKHHAAKKAYKRACGWKITADGLRKIDADSLRVTYTYFPPADYRYDKDNLDARMKAATDAIRDIAGIDDHLFSFGETKIETPIRPHGMVKCEITWTPREALAELHIVTREAKA